MVVGGGGGVKHCHLFIRIDKVSRFTLTFSSFLAEACCTARDTLMILYLGREQLLTDMSPAAGAYHETISLTAMPTCITSTQPSAK